MNRRPCHLLGLLLFQSGFRSRVVPCFLSLSLFTNHPSSHSASPNHIANEANTDIQIKTPIHMHMLGQLVVWVPSISFFIYFLSVTCQDLVEMWGNIRWSGYCESASGARSYLSHHYLHTWPLAVQSCHWTIFRARKHVAWDQSDENDDNFSTIWPTALMICFVYRNIFFPGPGDFPWYPLLLDWLAPGSSPLTHLHHHHHHPHKPKPSHELTYSSSLETSLRTGQTPTSTSPPPVDAS